MSDTERTMTMVEFNKLDDVDLISVQNTLDVLGIGRVSLMSMVDRGEVDAILIGKFIKIGVGSIREMIAEGETRMEEWKAQRAEKAKLDEGAKPQPVAA